MKPIKAQHWSPGALEYLDKRGYMLMNQRAPIKQIDAAKIISKELVAKGLRRLDNPGATADQLSLRINGGHIKLIQWPPTPDDEVMMKAALIKPSTEPVGTGSDRLHLDGVDLNKLFNTRTRTVQSVILGVIALDDAGLQMVTEIASLKAVIKTMKAPQKNIRVVARFNGQAELPYAEIPDEVITKDLIKGRYGENYCIGRAAEECGISTKRFTKILHTTGYLKWVDDLNNDIKNQDAKVTGRRSYPTTKAFNDGVATTREFIDERCSDEWSTLIRNQVLICPKGIDLVNEILAEKTQASV